MRDTSKEISDRVADRYPVAPPAVNNKTLVDQMVSRRRMGCVGWLMLEMLHDHVEVSKKFTRALRILLHMNHVNALDAYVCW